MRRSRRASAIVFALSWGLSAAAFSSEPARAPDGQFADRAKLIGSDSARMIRIRQDFFTRATGCPLYVVALVSSDGSGARERAAELFTRWHAEEKRLPDEAILLVVFAAEKSGGIVLGPTVPKEYEDALADMPALRWDDDAAAGTSIDRFIFDLDARLGAPAETLKRRRASFIPPVPRSYVLDGDDRFPDAARARMETGLAALAKSSGHPILAVIDPPGLTLALGDFSGADAGRWVDAAFAQWRRDRPELENGAVVFAFTGTFSGSIALGRDVEGKVSPDVSRDLLKDVTDGQTAGNFDRAIVRVAETLDHRFAGKKTVSIRSPWWIVLHPGRLLTGPDEEISTAFEAGSVAVFLLFVGVVLYLVLTHPKLVLAEFAGMALGGLIGGALSNVAGDAVGDAAGKFVGGLGGSGGGGSSGSW
jgi:uncharacterized membrane protein YgcG